MGDTRFLTNSYSITNNITNNINFMLLHETSNKTSNGDKLRQISSKMKLYLKDIKQTPQFYVHLKPYVHLKH